MLEGHFVGLRGYWKKMVLEMLWWFVQKDCFVKMEIKEVGMVPQVIVGVVMSLILSLQEFASLFPLHFPILAFAFLYGSMELLATRRANIYLLTK